MDINALTSAALDNLQKETLPRIITALNSLKTNPNLDDSERAPLRNSLRETAELLNLILQWTDQSSKPTVAQEDTGMSDAEAMRIMAEMDSGSTSPVPSDSMSDEDAQRLLAEMDAPPPTDQEPKLVKTLNQEMSAQDIIEIPEIAEWESNDFASDPEMMKDFSSNSADIMQTLDESILRLEQDPTNKETIEEIFRAAHTLKGAAGMFGFRAVERLMHRMENLFDNVRKGKLIPTADTIDAVLEGIDCLKKLLTAVLTQEPSGIKTAPIIRTLELATAGKSTGSTGKKSPANSDSINSSLGAQGEPSAPRSAPTASKKKTEQSETIRVDLDRLDALVNLVGELVIDRTRFQNIAEAIRSQAPHLKAMSSITETLQQFGRHMNEIQDIIMKVRMIPVGSVFNKYPRIVRDLARQLGKDIELVIEGEETEFDKTLVEQIADPLVHLIRNACDHGIETPDLRTSSGKSKNGKVVLSARQEGNQIIIQITDDGKGMDVTKIRSKAIEKGLIKPDQQLTNSEIFNLIFEPGFSTAEKVTTVSGRGVGMDVVRKQIAKLKGTVEIDSNLGKGSTITIRLPLTLAIVQSLLVAVEQETLAIPLNSVIESIRVKPSEIQKVGDSEILKLRDKAIPVYHLSKVLGLDCKSEDYWYDMPTGKKQRMTISSASREDRKYAVIIGTAERRYGVIVDALISQQEMVIKPLGHMMQGIPCVAGGAVLGDGEVVLVMDTAELEGFYKAKRPNQSVA